MAKLPTTLRELCTPAYIYLIINMIFIIISGIQNYKNTTIYQLGMFSCDVPSCSILFVIEIIYILFWTWVLNLICKDGHTSIAWFLLLLPFVLFFVLIGLLFITQTKMKTTSQEEKEK